ncbi:serine endopeptidase [Micractinium conductrix]|uniref:Serine endopeptidase n=1 Tax=Micractinium conductrix TaxID=554055 RepID=A0A2P6VP95_9CHLO|nr:serine endopeptidase [Micractinium conductrix]|eukprot:PSC75924.1 serine endopeptidase [Micractinium conductrix]
MVRLHVPAQRQDTSTAFCGGALLDERTVLTGRRGQPWNRSEVVVEAAGGALFNVTSIFVHPGFDQLAFESDNDAVLASKAAPAVGGAPANDLALLQLAAPVAAPATSASLPTAATPLPAGTEVQVAGWGVTDDVGPGDRMQDDLRWARLLVLPTDSVVDVYADNLLAGGTGGNTCSGDSGCCATPLGQRRWWE